MLSLASQNAPNKEEYKKKKGALYTVSAVARQRWRQFKLSVIPFGSSVTGLCEGSSDVDMVLFFPEACPTPHQALRRLRKAFMSRPDVKVSLALLSEKTKRPLLCLDIRGVRCDLTCQNVLPVFNTALLRSYVDLLPEIPVLSMVIKRWAKACKIGQVQSGAISSYAWTLMTVYYLQVCHGLPSLHILCPTGDLRAEGTEPTKTFALGFVQNAQKQELKRCLGDLLGGFFEFFSEQFDWGNEVVSVRLGKRLPAKDPEFSILPRKQFRGFRDILKIEDPIEISRNLNFALSERSSRRIRELISGACITLKGGGSLADLLRSQNEIAISNCTAVQEQFANFSLYRLPPGRTARSITRSQTSEARHRCQECFRWLPNMTSLQQHQQATNHSGSLLLRSVQPAAGISGIAGMRSLSFQEFLKSKKEDTGREAMGPQKKVMRNELGEEVVTSNEDMLAEAVRDGTLKGLGFASHRDAKLERIKVQALGTESELKGLKELPKEPLKGEIMKLEVKAEVYCNAHLDQVCRSETIFKRSAWKADMINFLILAVSGDDRKHRWLGSGAKSAPLRSLVQEWARAHNVSETGVALEKDGVDLDLSRSASDYAWEMDEVELYSWPTRQEYMAPEDKTLEPIRMEGAQSTASSLMQVSSSTRERLESRSKKAEEKPAQVKSKPETKKAPGAVKPKPKARSSGFKTAGAGDKEPLPSPDEEIEFVQQNPKKAGGKGFDRYELYKKAKTIAEAMALGAAKGDILFDWERKWFRRK
ncbi:URT1 [Symbiodinium sp. CCMP2456]|nr:URT1 [Symbiodinium sp. CCMP2456]